MSFFGFTLTTGAFLAAGVICAFGPIIIHLLNRRRFKVVQWAAMDFLREAMQRNRRIMQIRDLILLALRTAAVFFFGLALAQPFFSKRQEGLNEHQPVHAILVVDNSLSMDYGTTAEGTGLSRAKDKAKALIDKLPAGSKISIIPVCGSREAYSPDPFDTKENALEALQKIEIVDRSATVLKAVNEAKKANEAAPDLAKRIIFISDQQESNWRDLGAEELKALPAMQIVDVSLPNPKNAWVADLRVQDGLADVETPSTIVVQVQYSGLEARRDVNVKLFLGDAEIGQKPAVLEAGDGTREVDFEYIFNALSEMPEPGKPVFVTLQAVIDPDELPADDQRFLAVPVVAALPVVFVDQYGAEDEDPGRNKLGETIRLRKLLAPKAAREEAPRQVVKIKHLRADELSQDVLADARLVVIAGLPNIDDVNTVPLLRDYVKQGGQLLLAAGAEFSPDAWNAAAWKDGDGILPAPLKRETIGEVPEAAGENLRPFFLSFESLSGDDFFQLAGMPENDLRDLYSEAFFFKAVEADVSKETLDAWKESQRKRLTEELAFLAAAEKRKAEREAKSAGGTLSEADRKQQLEDEVRLKELRPDWLTWAHAAGSPAEPAGDLPADDAARQARINGLVKQQLPRVLARFSDDRSAPFLVQRTIGRGNVIFCTSGLSSSWNTLLTTNATVIFDRILRSMVQATLPRRNYDVQERLTLPLVSEDHDLTVSLSRPGDAPPEPLDIGYIGKEQRGVTVHGMYQRGAYRVSAYRGQPASVDPSQPAAADKPVWEIPLVVNGESEESVLAPLSREKFEERSGASNLRWVGVGEEISLAGATIQGQNWWWYLVLFVFACLIVEMGILAWPTFRPEPT